MNCLNLKRRFKKERKESGEYEPPMARIWRLEYSDEKSDADLILESEYYNSKRLRKEDPKSALEGFKKVLELERELTNWGFRALKQMIKIHLEFAEFRQMESCFETLLSYLDSTVTPNYAAKSMESILNKLYTTDNHDIMEHYAEILLDTVLVPPHDRLWFAVKHTQAKLRVTEKNYSEAQEVFLEMRQYCELLNTWSGCKKEEELMHIYNEEIQMCKLMNDKKKLKDLYDEVVQLKAATVANTDTG